MEDKVVDLVVAVDQRATIFGLCLWVAKEGDHIVKVWYVAHRLIRVNINSLCLRARDGSEGPNLSIVEAR